MEASRSLLLHSLYTPDQRALAEGHISCTQKCSMVAWGILCLCFAAASTYLLIDGIRLANRALLLGGACFCALGTLALLALCQQCLRSFQQKKNPIVEIDLKSPELLIRLASLPRAKQRELVKHFTEEEVAAHLKNIDRLSEGSILEKWRPLRTMLLCRAGLEACTIGLWKSDPKDRITIYQGQLLQENLTPAHTDYLIDLLLDEIKLFDDQNNVPEIYKKLVIKYAKTSSPEKFFSVFSKKVEENQIKYSPQELLTCFGSVPLLSWIEKGPKVIEKYALCLHSHKDVFYAGREQRPALWADYQTLLQSTLPYVRPHFALEQRLRLEGCYFHLDSYLGLEEQLQHIISLKPPYKERVYKKIVENKEKILELKRFFLESPNSIVLFLSLEDSLKKAICEQMTLSEVFFFVEKFDSKYTRYQEELTNIAKFYERSIEDCVKLPGDFLKTEISRCLSKRESGLVYFAAKMANNYFVHVPPKQAYEELGEFYNILDSDVLKRAFLCNGLLGNVNVAENFSENRFFLKEMHRLESQFQRS